MKSENILLIAPVLSSWHVLGVIRNEPLMQASPKDRAAKRAFSYLANGLKNRLTEIALVITTIFVSLYSLITYPYRWYQAAKYEEMAIQQDINRLTPEERKATEAMIHAYFKRHEKDFASLSPKEKNKLSRKVISQCARSQKVYGPVVRHWADNLLETANREKKKLVFMARDGIPFYRVARRLMEREEYKEKYPWLAQKKTMVLGYFSRKVVSQASDSPQNKEIFNRYISKELGIREGQECIFADIGFSGSMVKPIRNLLPNIKIDFKFLIATSDLAEGFLSNPQNPLSNLKIAANNLGVRWAEETHHGTTASATKLVMGTNGHIYPDSLYPKRIRCEEKFSLPYLLRKFCLRGVVNYAVHLPELSQQEAEKAKEIFNQTIGDIKSSKLPIFLGWDR